MTENDKEIADTIRTIQADVKARLDDAFKNPLKKEWQGSDPTAGFNDKEVFSDDNWNDGRISLFRTFFASAWGGGGISNQLVFIGDLEIVHEWHEDQNYVFIHNCRTNDLYHMTWYKSRGRTELILCNGHKITLGEFKALLVEMLKPQRCFEE